MEAESKVVELKRPLPPVANPTQAFLREILLELRKISDLQEQLLTVFLPTKAPAKEPAKPAPKPPAKRSRFRRKQPTTGGAS